MNTVEQHPLVGRRVRVAAHAQHYPHRHGLIAQWMGFDTVIVSLDPYKRAPARRQRYWLTDLIVQPIVQPEQGAQHVKETRTHA
jgi:hypothetical protein